MLQDVQDRQLSLGHVGRLFTVFQAAEILGSKESTIRQWIAQGKIGVIRLGRSVRIPENELYRVTSQGWAPPAHR